MATPTTSAMSTVTSATANSTSTSNPNSTDPSGGKPLLFFVALGFGVVFTNLWIIVGVKYCFRYNQRNRHPQIDNETGQPIDLGNIPRPRRRREKKLMSMDEVNERFPLTKYKAWRASRETQGLPAAGGVTAPPSRAASIKENMLVRKSTEVDEPSFAEPSSPKAPLTDPAGQVTDFAAQMQTSPEITTTNSPHVISPQPQLDSSDEKNKSATIIEKEADPASSTPAAIDDDDGGPIQIATLSDNTDLLRNPGDACAICIDNLDDDDDVRGLTCGHAFHAGCLDPWLTNRRACCPLCKADYYVSKPRPGATTDAAVDPAIAAGASNDVQPPASAWTGLGGRGGLSIGHRVVFAGSRFHVDSHGRHGFPILVRDPPQPHHSRNERRAQMGLTAEGVPNHVTEDDDITPVPTHAPEVQDEQDAPSASTGNRFWRGLTSRFRPRHDTTTGTTTLPNTTGDASGHTTPGQLEAGVAAYR